MTFLDRTTAIIEYERGEYVCPLLFPKPDGKSCPISDPYWAKSAYVTTHGARLRHQLDRKSEPNTLTYVLINLHALQRVRQRKAERLENM